MNEPVFNPDHHTSWNIFDHAVVELIRLIDPYEIIDIGAGSGKYSKLIDQANLAKKPNRIAIEPGKAATKYLTDEGLYDQVHNADTQILYADPMLVTDLVIMGDVLEHMKASEGLDLLQYLTYRSSYILILTPDAMPMFANGDFYGCHNSMWRPEMFKWHDNWAYGQNNNWGAQLQLFLLRGYAGREKRSLRDVADRFNALGCPILHEAKGSDR